MKLVKVPEKQEQFSFPKVWEEIVFPQAAFRANLVNTRASIAIDTKVQSSEGAFLLTDSEHELLMTVMQLQGMQVGPPALLRFYMRCLEAVQDAVTPREEPKA